MQKKQIRDRYRQNHKLLGYCVDCTQDAMVGYIRCYKHWDQQREANKRYYKRISEKRIKQVTERQNRLVSDGKCRSCGRDREDEGTSVYCYACACYALERRVR